jgi:hypothetical protein
MGESNNQALTRLLANSLWPTLMPYLAAADAMPTERLAAHPDREQLAAALATHLRGLNVAKVKVYDLGGRTVFSTEASQIGEEKSNNPGFQAALFGRITSELTHRDEFSAFDRVIENADLLSTYIPVRRATDGAVGAVFEVYDDVTPFLARVERMQWMVVLGVFLHTLRALWRAVRDRASCRRRDPAAIPAARCSGEGAAPRPAHARAAGRGAHARARPRQRGDCRPKSPNGVLPTSA